MKITTEKLNCGLRVFVDGEYSGKIGKKGSYWKIYVWPGSKLHGVDVKLENFKARSVVGLLDKIRESVK